MKTTLVVPTNGAERLRELLQAWTPWPWDEVIVVVDGPEVFDVPADPRLRQFCWGDIDAALPTPQVISRRDSAVRSFGFWRAWADGADVVLTLDDDCFPAGDDWLAGHLRNLYATPRWESSVPALRVRGIPYRDLGILTGVALSVGLWTGVPDFDAISTLARAGGPASIGDVRTRVMSSDAFFPMSGMNLAFPRWAAPLMLFAPMGDGQPFGRFDDIWCGLVVQHVCRHLRLPIVCGHPYVDHRRASDPIANLVKEAPGVAANETLWRTLDAITLTAGDPLGCMAEVGAALRGQDDPYLAGWGQAVGWWCELFGAP